MLSMTICCLRVQTNGWLAIALKDVLVLVSEGEEIMFAIQSVLPFVGLSRAWVEEKYFRINMFCGVTFVNSRGHKDQNMYFYNFSDLVCHFRPRRTGTGIRQYDRLGQNKLRVARAGK